MAENCDEATREHTINVGFCSSRAAFRKEFGNGVGHYFDTLQLTALHNTVLVIIGLYGFLPHFQRLDFTQSNSSLFPELFFFSSSIAEEDYYSWLLSGIASALWSLFLPAVLTVYHWRARRSADDGAAHAEWGGEADEIVYRVGGQEDGARLKHSAEKRWWRRRITTALSVLVIVAQGILMLLLQSALVQYAADQIATLAIAIVVNLLKSFLKLAAKRLTDLELHEHWTSHKNSTLFRSFGFKLSNIVSVYIAKYALSAWTGDGRCNLRELGEQFLWIALLDVSVGNFLELAFPYGLKHWKGRRVAAASSRLSNDQLRSPFELDDEYETVLYRQFIVLMACTSSPLVPAVTLIANILEYAIDRYKLVYILAKPPRLEAFSARTLTTLAAAAWSVAMLMPPDGMVWVLSGKGEACFFDNT